MTPVMRRLVSALATGALLVGPAGCNSKAPASKATTKPVVKTTTVRAAAPDCDADDRGHKEVPDCGFLEGGRYYEWTWVQAGDTTPPPNWNADTDRKQILSGR